MAHQLRCHLRQERDRLGQSPRSAEAGGERHGRHAGLGTVVGLADHRRELATDRGEKVSWDDALESFATLLPGGAVEGRA